MLYQLKAPHVNVRLEKTNGAISVLQWSDSCRPHPDAATIQRGRKVQLKKLKEPSFLCGPKFS